MESFGLGHFFMMLLYVVLLVVPCWRIVSKAGYPGVWALLALVPVLNLVFLWIFAFLPWPNERPGRHA